MRMSTSIFVATSDQDRLYRGNIKLNVFGSNEKKFCCKMYLLKDPSQDCWSVKSQKG